MEPCSLSVQWYRVSNEICEKEKKHGEKGRKEKSTHVRSAHPSEPFTGSQ